MHTCETTDPNSTCGEIPPFKKEKKVQYTPCCCIAAPTELRYTHCRCLAASPALLPPHLLVLKLHRHDSHYAIEGKLHNLHKNFRQALDRFRMMRGQNCQHVHATPQKQNKFTKTTRGRLTSPLTPPDTNRPSWGFIEKLGSGKEW